jgi:tRNA U34 5-methylaminomethyl-2-thiouridine-forming methyltransferase MnmC
LTYIYVILLKDNRLFIQAKIVLFKLQTSSFSSLEKEVVFSNHDCLSHAVSQLGIFRCLALISMAASWLPLLTEDGSYTFFSAAFNEAFHSRQGAKTEAIQKFVEATHLPAKAQQNQLQILDVCYGLGYNTAAALEMIWQINPACKVEIIGLELDESVPLAAISETFLAEWSCPVQEALVAIARQHHYQSPTLTATLLLGDARKTIKSVMQEEFQANAIFFDPFSPRRCPQLWSIEFFQCIAQCLAPTGRLATYSRAASVRVALQSAGLKLGSLPVPLHHAPHEWSQGTIASWQAEDLHPLSQMEQEHLQTRAAIPYRDPQLSDPAETILARHQQEQACTSLESTSSWRRRWKIQ